MIAVTILGATGTIGVNTLDVLARHPQLYRPLALTANQDVDGLFGQCCQWHPDYAVMADADAAERLRQKLAAEGSSTTVLAGVDGLTRVAALPEVDCVMAAIVGAAGLLPTLAAVRAGKRVLLANKEALVMSGELLIAAAEKHQAVLLPIDSEHNAIFQCLPDEQRHDMGAAGMRRVLLTSSGGPFRTFPPEQLANVTPEQACAHPNWVMGRKISVDSATMMNKGLEVIEACHLFAITAEQIEVVVHPQSVIHSMVEYIDGSVLAQMATPDMRVPIAHALAWPERITSGADNLDVFALAQLTFEKADEQRFPCLRLAYSAAREGGTAPAILNAANEVAVAAFLAGSLPFTAIADVVEMTTQQLSSEAAVDIETVIAADLQARRTAESILPALARQL